MQHSASWKSLKKCLTSKHVLKLCPPTHWTQFALCTSAYVPVRLHSHVCSCEPFTVKSNFWQYYLRSNVSYQHEIKTIIHPRPLNDSEWGLLQLNILSRATGNKWTGNVQAEATSQLLLPNTVSTVESGVTLFWGQRKTYTLNRFTGTGHGGSNSYQSSIHFISMLYCPSSHALKTEKGRSGNHQTTDTGAHFFSTVILLCSQ